MKKTDDREFVNGLRRGDAGAWRSLFERYYAVYVRFVGKIVGDFTAAKDIVQDVFLKLWRNRGSLAPESSVERLLYVIARNSAFTFLRDRRTFVPVDDVPSADREGISVEDELLLNERREILDEAVKSLPKQRQAVIDLKMGGVRTAPYPKSCSSPRRLSNATSLWRSSI